MSATPLIVGMGASAGGLNAFKAFFTHMPADSGMAFVLVQHLDPHHKSMLVELLGRHTAMAVTKPRIECGLRQILVRARATFHRVLDAESGIDLRAALETELSLPNVPSSWMVKGW